MLLSYYTKICIPIIGLNFKHTPSHYQIIAHNAVHKHTCDIVKIIIPRINYFLAIQYIEQTKVFNNISLTARSPPIFSTTIMLYPHYHRNIRRW